MIEFTEHADVDDTVRNILTIDVNHCACDFSSRHRVQSPRLVDGAAVSRMAVQKRQAGVKTKDSEVGLKVQTNVENRVACLPKGCMRHGVAQRYRSKLNDAGAISVDDAHGECAKVDNEALLELVDALAQQVETFLERHVGPVVAIERRHCKEGTVTMCGKGNSGERTEVVDPVQSRFGTWQVEAAEQQVDLVRLSGA